MVNIYIIAADAEITVEWEEHMMQEKSRIFTEVGYQKVINCRYEGHQIDEFGDKMRGCFI